MEINYKNYEIEITEDRSYVIKSNHNLISYKYEYHNGQINTKRIYPINKRGITVTDKTVQAQISSAILCENGGKTEVSERVVEIDKDQLWIAVGDRIYALDLPNLTIHLFSQIDHGTIYSINQFKGDLLILGELGVTRLSKNGTAKWRFIGNGIFISGNNNITIKESHIELIDGNNQTYLIDEHGELYAGSA